MAPSVTDTQEIEGLGAIVHSLHKGLKGFLGLLTSEAEISKYVEGKQEKDSGGPTHGIKNTIKRISGSPFYSPSANSVAPYGYYCSRPIVGDCSPISGGIYLSTRPVEAVVIDEKYDTLRLVLKDFRGRIAGVIGQNSLNDHQLLKFTMEYVREHMDLNAERVEKINKSLKGSEDRKVALDSYINSGFGATRHLVLLSGFLMEGLKRSGMAIGCASVDTSQPQERLIYTSTTGDLFILDFSNSVLEAGH